MSESLSTPTDDMTAEMALLPHSPTLPRLGLYIHWPFCVSKCPYCDFNSHIAATIDEAAYFAAYAKELKAMRALTGPRILHSIYFGGGTPSLMSGDLVHKLMDAVRSLWPFHETIEITIEANPNSADVQKFRAFQQAGINRVSLGIQALDDQVLSFLGRPHTKAEGLTALAAAQETFTRSTFDLIYARPDQTLAAWEKELNEALRYGTDHLSLYQLTIEPNTPFDRQHARGKLILPPEDLQADFYHLTEEIMGNAGYGSYEISNYAKPGCESRHNLLYWQSQDWGAVGPGAHGRLTTENGRFLFRRHRAPLIWKEKAMAQDPHVPELATDLEPLSQIEQAEEYFMMGLRLSTGIEKQAFEDAVGAPFNDFVQSENFMFLQESGFITETPTHLQASLKGRLCLGTLLGELLV